MGVLLTGSKYEELQVLTEKYGLETLAFYEKVKAIGPNIVEAYIDYLGGPKTAANAVPPDGDFDPSMLHRDAAFDCYGRGTIFLEPIRMGVCTEIRNQSDRGATWVRTVLSFFPDGGRIRLFIGSKEHQIHVGEIVDDVMAEICEAIFTDAREAFSIELDEAQGRSRIGFTSQTG
ncbi:hypothetical protein [Nioella aestuarii]|uniref:hypothetical protein n=1 Tax=Nioella aestuarii TaxID=1662864 RepID=UPI003D7F65E0